MQHPQRINNLYDKGDKYYSGYVTRYWRKNESEKDKTEQ